MQKGGVLGLLFLISNVIHTITYRIIAQDSAIVQIWSFFHWFFSLNSDMCIPKNSSAHSSRFFFVKTFTENFFGSFSRNAFMPFKFYRILILEYLRKIVQEFFWYIYKCYSTSSLFLKLTNKNVWSARSFFENSSVYSDKNSFKSSSGNLATFIFKTWNKVETSGQIKNSRSIR